MAVSFASPASENHSDHSPSPILHIGEQAPEGQSSGRQIKVSQRTLCEENRVERGADAEATATSVLATRWASRNTPSRENAATPNIAVRVTTGAYSPEPSRPKPDKPTTRGGCALEGVEMRNQPHVSSRSRAAGT